ncbi:MAG: AmmeMemoRadiSam system protein B [Chthonomonadales bacterium]
MAGTRMAAVAGLFYPGTREDLERLVTALLKEADCSLYDPPKALIAPHAGYIYSGPVAAHAYACVAPLRNTVRRVVIVGPAHTVPIRFLAASSADYWDTPLGRVPLDGAANQRLAEVPGVQFFDRAHSSEHSIEVHLPFLQVVLERFTLVPLVAGDTTEADVELALDAVWGGPETLIVVSSDLSHYHDYDTARRLDLATAEAIEKLSPAQIAPDRACGSIPIRGLLRLARRRGLRVHRLDLRNSGDTTGTYRRDRVVGYGAWAFTPAREASAA